MKNKKKYEDLAWFGGEPLFGTPLCVGTLNIGVEGRFHEKMKDILKRRWLTNNGVYVQELENAIAALVEVKHCVLYAMPQWGSRYLFARWG